MKKILVLLIILFSFKSYSQNYAFYNDYRSYKNIKKGTYYQKSTLKKYLDLRLPIIRNNSKSIEINKGFDFIKISESSVVHFWQS